MFDTMGKLLSCRRSRRSSTSVIGLWNSIVDVAVAPLPSIIRRVVVSTMVGSMQPRTTSCRYDVVSMMLLLSSSNTKSTGRRVVGWGSAKCLGGG